jgi:hypothetical protein
MSVARNAANVFERPSEPEMLMVRDETSDLICRSYSYTTTTGTARCRRWALQLLLHRLDRPRRVRRTGHRNYCCLHSAGSPPLSAAPGCSSGAVSRATFASRSFATTWAGFLYWTISVEFS